LSISVDGTDEVAPGGTTTLTPILGMSVEVGDALVGVGVGEDLFGEEDVGEDFAEELEGMVLDGTSSGELGGMFGSLEEAA